MLSAESIMGRPTGTRRASLNPNGLGVVVGMWPWWTSLVGREVWVCVFRSRIRTLSVFIFLGLLTPFPTVNGSGRRRGREAPKGAGREHPERQG